MVSSARTWLCAPRSSRAASPRCAPAPCGTCRPRRSRAPTLRPLCTSAGPPTAPAARRWTCRSHCTLPAIKYTLCQRQGHAGQREGVLGTKGQAGFPHFLEQKISSFLPDWKICQFLVLENLAIFRFSLIFPVGTLNGVIDTKRPKVGAAERISFFARGGGGGGVPPGVFHNRLFC